MWGLCGACQKLIADEAEGFIESAPRTYIDEAEEFMESKSACILTGLKGSSAHGGLGTMHGF